MGFDPESIFRRGPRPRVVRPRPPHISRGRAIGIGIAVVVVLILLLARTFMGLRVDYLFYSSLGHTNVFWTPFVAQVLLFLIGFAVTAVLMGLNIPVWRAEARSLDEHGAAWATWAGAALSVFAGIVAGGFLAGQWQTVLLWLHGGSFGATDPVFGKDYSFYVFTLPILDALQGIAWGIALISLLSALAVAVLAAIAENTPAEVPLPLRPPAGRSAGDAVAIAARHAGVLLVAIFALAALGAHYTVFHMTTAQHSDYNFVGLDATQRNVTRPVMGVLQWVAAGFALITAGLLATRWRRPAPHLGGVLAGLLVTGMVVSALAQVVPPLIYNAAYATPNAQSAQLPSIDDYLTASRYAWGLQPESDVRARSFSQNVTAPSLADLATDPGTLSNVRIQDPRCLPDSLNQIQKTRAYQTFGNVDCGSGSTSNAITVDRYPATDGSDVEVMLAPREIDSSNVPGGFNNQALIYTHGYGVAAVSVNGVDPNGNPSVLVGNQPMTALPNTTSSSGTAVPPALAFNGSTSADPRIYCGLSMNQNVVVNTKASEFDYPLGSGDHTSSAGDVRGIPVDNFFDRLSLSLVDYGGTDLLLTNQLTPDSRALIHRTIADRVQTLAPFLTVDNDPYVVVDPRTGHLMYIADAYVSSDQFPNSYQLSDSGISYMRNAVKAVVDAKTCDTTLYAVDPSEPLTAAWSSIYPGLLTPLSQMPAGLRSHLRYPEDYFTDQAQVYAQVHVSSASVFFNGSDRYKISQEIVGSGPNQQDTSPYYVELTLPGDKKPSFVLLQTFSSGSGSGGTGSSSNLTAWLAAECDYSDGRPKLDAVPLNNAVNIRGPLQFEQNLNTDPTISHDVSLLNQSGSHVEWGNVIVLPFNNHSFLYVRPLYVAATAGNGTFPQLRRVMVGTQDNVAEGNTLTDALQTLFNTNQPIPGLQPPVQPSQAPQPTQPAQPTQQPGQLLTGQEIALLNDLLAHEQAAQQALKNGDLVTYAKEETAVQNDAAQLRQLLSQQPSATPSPSPAAPSSTP